MRSLLLLLLPAATVLLPLAGCARFPGGEQRTESFAPHAGTMVGGVPVRSHLLMRVTPLLIGASVGPGTREEERFRVPVSPADGRGFEVGIATAIDRRGYLLTAAHCVGTDAANLLGFGGTTLEAVAVRVVWRGDVSRGEPDLAVLSIDAALPHVFTWAEEFAEDDPVLAVGIFRDEAGQTFRKDGLAGLLLRVSDPTGKARAREISHNVPLRPGDSGGPVTTTDGRLIAVNVTTIAHFNLLAGTPTWTGRAVRPDLDWLRRVVDEDHVRRAGSPPAPR